MKEAVVLSRSEIRKILAMWYHVDEKDVLPSKYSFTVIKETEFPTELVQEIGTKSAS